MLAFIGAVTRHTIELAVRAARWAVKLKSAVAEDHDLPQAGLIVGKLVLKLVKRCNYPGTPLLTARG